MFQEITEAVLELQTIPAENIADFPVASVTICADSISPEALSPCLCIAQIQLLACWAELFN